MDRKVAEEMNDDDEKRDLFWNCLERIEMNRKAEMKSRHDESPYFDYAQDVVDTYLSNSDGKLSDPKYLAILIRDQIDLAVARALALR